MYSHDETVEAVHNFYLELTKLTYPDESWLRTPPPEGWDADHMAKTYEALSDKTETVKCLLKHLPYLRTEPYGRANSTQDILLAYETIALCYAIPPGIYSNQPGSPDDLYPLPPHCVYITDGEAESTRLILDTEKGNITELGIGNTGLSKYTVPREEYNSLPEHEKWRAYPTMPVREFFEKWTRYYAKLVWMLTPASTRQADEPNEGRWRKRARMPQEQRRLADAEGNLQEWQPDITSLPEHLARDTLQAAEVYNTHLRHGWPTNFDQEGCRRALLAYESTVDQEDEGLGEDASRDAGT